MSTIQVDVADLVEVSDELNNAADLMKAGAARAVNTVAAEAREDTVREITSQINLRRNYVDSKVEFTTDATPERPQATIEIGDEAVLLSEFGVEQKTISNVWDEAKYREKFGSLSAPARLPNGKKAPWIPRTGDQLRGIPKGQKQNGLRIQIGTKGADNFDHVFLRPILSGLKVFGGQGLNGRMGAFSRPKGGGKPSAKYGPSPYQAAKGVWRDAEPHIADRLEEEVTKNVTEEFTKELKTK